MRIVIRADSSTQIGGGHIMRCLSLAAAAQAAGHEVLFVSANVEGNLGKHIKALGIDVYWLKVQDAYDSSSNIESWRPMAIERDVDLTCQTLSDFSPDWVILDHYGLGGAWVKGIRLALPDLKVLALDDLDREPLFADLLLNPAAVRGTQFSQSHLCTIKGPSYAMLRSEFLSERPKALKHRTGDVKKVLILPGMIDNANFAPTALNTLQAFPDLHAEVIMGSQSPSLDQVQEMVNGQLNWTLTLDANDMASRMRSADICIGAGGGSAWERCCMGLPSVNIALSENQKPGIQALAKAGAAVGLDASALQQTNQIENALHKLIADFAVYSKSAATLCDGRGAARIVAAMSGQLRAVTQEDAQLIFDWRNQAHIRDVSKNSNSLQWDKHNSYLQQVLADPVNHIWRIYQEDDIELGLVNARREDDGYWIWSFYIGASDAPKGAGGRMLLQFLRQMNRQPDFAGIRATVVATNHRSHALHEMLGFQREWAKPTSEVQYRLDVITLNARLGIDE